MSEFILFRPMDAIGPSFNGAAQKLSENPSVQIKKKQEMGPMGMILIEAAPQDISAVQKSLPGWMIEGNQKMRLS